MIQINSISTQESVFAPIKGCMNLLFLAIHTVLWCIPMYCLFFLKILSRQPRWRRIINWCLVGTANNWIRTNNLMISLAQNIEWDLPNFDHLKLNDWYFIICNHQSWTDILILHKIFLKKTPFIRFFIKKELRWLPVLNLAWWAYDFPIMHRHSKEILAKYPELRDKDMLATQKACQVYKNSPVSILNFLEGTRFTPAKHAKQHSPYKHLLIPKAGGFAFAVNAMDKKITHILDVTILYPLGPKSFWDLLCGRVHKIIVKLQEREIPTELLQGDYTDDDKYREQFKQWINTFWEEKDTLIDSLVKTPY